MGKFRFYRQLDSMDCGPTCLRMVAEHYGKHFSLENLRALTKINREGVSLWHISQAANAIGLDTLSLDMTLDDFKKKIPLPCILFWQKKHFVVLYKLTPTKAYIADPGRGKIVLTIAEFTRGWAENSHSVEEERGIVLLLFPTEKFETLEEDKKTALNLRYIFNYWSKYKSLVFQLVIGLLLGMLVQLAFPFLTQSLVDVGIRAKDLNLITIILLAQLSLFVGQASIEFLRSWILLHISTRINLSILYDYLSKLMRLPMSYFDSKLMGDILQRMTDHQRIENFLTNQSLNSLFGVFSLVVFSGILAYYNWLIFFIFIGASIIHVLYITIFLKKRRDLDNKSFQINSRNQSSVIQIIQGMQEIKLTNSEDEKLGLWSDIQLKHFTLQLKTLALTQYQETGAFFITNGKNIIISYLSAVSVVNGNITLGAMLAIQFIIGQLNSPIQQIISFMQSTQDAKLSLERLNEIHTLQNEEDPRSTFEIVPASGDILLKNVEFSYPGLEDEPVLKNLNATFKRGEITAIVGSSGSGKTTILKLLLMFYLTQSGDISIDQVDFKRIQPSVWRKMCGAVMQDGYIFSDTIAKNIAVGELEIDLERLHYAAEFANIKSFIDTLPLSFETIIGAEGSALSQGQKQRVLIARVIYKNPEFIFFDEATNALDASNETSIVNNLEQFFHKKTVIIVAHRLSTIKKADNIIVLDKGEIVEQGTHVNLLNQQGYYYRLIKDQLELDKTI
jgi:ATP-binding cassette subfamily B protein